MPEQLFSFYESRCPLKRFTLSSNTLTAKFEAWLIIKSRQPDVRKLKYYARNVIVRAFIADTENGGLGAGYDDKDFDIIFALLGPIASEWKNH